FEMHITNSEIIEEVESLVEKEIRHSIKDILNFIIPSMINKENYSTLQVELALLIDELHEIKTGFIDQNKYKWKIELYISAD
ncbi:8520_t:CDS:2, partial [Cetraspora pellucida]